MAGIIPPGHPQALPQGSSLLPSGLKAALLNILTLGEYQHPGTAKSYLEDTAKEFDPRTRNGLIALGATIFGPRLGEPEISGARAPDGLPVPLVRVNRQHVAHQNPARNLTLDTAPAVLKQLMLAREKAAAPVGAHVAHVQARLRPPTHVENAHEYAETAENLHTADNTALDSQQSAPRRVLAGLPKDARKNPQAVLLMRLLANHL